MFQTKFVTEIKTYFMLHFFSGSRAVYEMMWKNIVQEIRQYNTAHALCVRDI
jgi:hypothetical protein